MGNNYKISDVLPYFLFAYFFGWTKDEVDNHDSEFIEKMLLLVKSILESGKGKGFDMKSMLKGGIKP